MSMTLTMKAGSTMWGPGSKHYNQCLRCETEFTTELKNCPTCGSAELTDVIRDYTQRMHADGHPENFGEGEV